MQYDGGVAYRRVFDGAIALQEEIPSYKVMEITHRNVLKREEEDE